MSHFPPIKLLIYPPWPCCSNSSFTMTLASRNKASLHVIVHKECTLLVARRGERACRGPNKPNPTGQQNRKLTWTERKLIIKLRNWYYSWLQVKSPHIVESCRYQLISILQMSQLHAQKNTFWKAVYKAQSNVIKKINFWEFPKSSIY